MIHTANNKNNHIFLNLIGFFFEKEHLMLIQQLIKAQGIPTNGFNQNKKKTIIGTYRYNNVIRERTLTLCNFSIINSINHKYAFLIVENLPMH